MTWSAQTWPSILALLSVTSCEMFIGDFVEYDDTDGKPEEIITACDKPRICRGEQLESCTKINGVASYTLLETCASRALCNRALSECMSCVPDTFQCQGDVLQKCNATGSTWDVVKTCIAGNEKCDEDTGQCELCLPGDTKCEEREGAHYRLECQATSEGRVWTSTNCNTFVCRQDSEGAAYCENCTTVGEKTCAEMSGGEVSNAIVECTSELRWVTTPCPEGVCMDDQCVIP